MDWRRWTHLLAAAARRKILRAVNRRARASLFTLCCLVSWEGCRGRASRIALIGCVPLQLALLGFVGSAGWVQQLGRVRHCEQGAGFGVALTQRCVADFVALVLRRGGLELAYTSLDVLVVSHDLRDSQRPGFVDCWGGSASIICSPVLPDSRPSAMALVLVGVIVWLGMERGFLILPGRQGVRFIFQPAPSPPYECLFTSHVVRIRGWTPTNTTLHQ